MNKENRYISIEMQHSSFLISSISYLKINAISYFYSKWDKVLTQPVLEIYWSS